jgi:uncharacterized protein
MKRRKIFGLTLAAGFLFLTLPFSYVAGQDSSPQINALIITGQNNHNWKTSSTVLKQILEETGLFKVDIVISPPAGSDRQSFRPDFHAFKVVILDYNGDPWPPATRKAFVAYVKNGGGVVVYHAADNAFPSWPEYNEIIGLGGWGNRNEKSGPYVYWKDGKVVEDTRPGNAGYHGAQHDFLVINRDTSNPITAELPPKWMHAKDELYSLLRGPAKNLRVLATAYSDPAYGGTSRDEPVLFTVNYGAGRIFHTVLGHAGSDDPQPALECVGFIVTFQRGAEWAATGKVTQKIPGDFPATDLDTSNPADVRRWPGYRPPSLEDILKNLVSFEYSKDEVVLYRLREFILTHRNSSESHAACEEALISFLGSQANLYAKTAVCRQLRLIGSDRSVPVLEKMLLADDTTDMARYALEKIPGETAEQALLNALDKTRGTVKIGLISTLAQRRYRAAVNELAGLLNDQDRAIASAAVTALGRIGGPEAADILVRAFDKPGEDIRDSVASALLRCADDSFSSGDAKAAAGLYEKLQSALPQQLPVVLRQAAFKGKIASSGKQEAAGIILDTLSHGPQDMHLPTISLIAKFFDDSQIGPVCSLLPKLPEESQLPLLSVLSGFPKEAVLPFFLTAVQSPAPEVRIAALNALAKVGDASTVVLLAERAAATRGKEQEAARSSLYSLRGKDVDETILVSLISHPNESIQNELIQAIGERRVYAGKILLMGQTRSPSAKNRLQAIKALKVIASPEDVPTLLSLLLEMKEESEQEEMGNLVAGIAQKISQPYSQAKVVADMLEPQEGSAQKKVMDIPKRCLLLRVLGKIGDDSSLPLLRAALKDENAEVVDAAVRALADWPNITPREDLFGVAKNSSKLVHKVLGLQAYVKMIGLEVYQAPEGAVESLKKALDLATRPEEKKLVLGVLPNFSCPEALQLAESLLVDEAVTEEAQAAVDKIKETLEKSAQKANSCL